MNRRFFTSLLALSVILGTWKGYLAIFDRGAPEPRQIFPKQIAALPEQDQLDLTEGIVVRNQRDLERLLEDFLS